MNSHVFLGSLAGFGRDISVIIRKPNAQYHITSHIDEVLPESSKGRVRVGLRHKWRRGYCLKYKRAVRVENTINYRICQGLSVFRMRCWEKSLGPRAVS
jgi:hypothetical protein